MLVEFLEMIGPMPILLNKVLLYPNIPVLNMPELASNILIHGKLILQPRSPHRLYPYEIVKARRRAS
jgi:hypothetical protein